MSAGAGCKPWSLPELDGLGPVTVGDLESMHQDAHAQGFAEGRAEGDRRGYEEGRARAAAELEPRIAEFTEMIRLLADPLAEVDEEIETSLVSLATAIARQLVLHELSVRPELVADVVRDAMAALPLGSRTARVVLNPADLELVRERLEASDGHGGESNLRLVEDLGIARGGCRVQTDVSLIDATVESRLATVITQVLGGEHRPGAGTAGADGLHGDGETSAGHGAGQGAPQGESRPDRDGHR